MSFTQFLYPLANWIKLHATSSFLIIDGQALVVALGKPDADATFGDLAETYVKTVLIAGSEYHRIDVVFGRYWDVNNQLYDQNAAE